MSDVKQTINERNEAGIELGENALAVLKRRYLRKGDDGRPTETVEEMFHRVTSFVAAVETQWGGDPQEIEPRFYDLITNFRFMPNSPTFTGAGTPLGQLAACFVLDIEDDMGRVENGIFQTLRNAALIQQTGGGTGFSFSRLRPKGALVKSSGGRATGPVGFMKVYDVASGIVSQGGARRGANMAVLRVDHPDIMEFIRCKTKEGEIENFNISVAVTDEFMRAVEEDGNIDLVNPQDGEVWKTVRAREIFDAIVEQAHHNGEPGMLFLDTANRDNPTPHLGEYEATNPCVTGDTLVATPDGWRRADNIKAGDLICTVLGNKPVQTVEVNHDMPVYKIYLSDGGEVRATASHQFHVRDTTTEFFEPKRLDQVKIGEWVRVYRSVLPSNEVPQGNIHIPDDRLYGFLVGVLVGDGCYTPKGLPKNVVRISTHADDDEWNALLKQAFTHVGVTEMHSYVDKGSRSMMMDPKPGPVIAGWIRSLPLQPALGHEKSLPECYVNSNKEFLLGLLDGLFSTDGSVDLSSNYPLVRFHTSSEKLARQVRRILLMFGIHGRIFKSARDKHDIDGREIRNDRPKYDVVISGQSFGRFFEQIRLSHPDKQRRMEEAALRCNFTGGNWAAKVLKIEPDGVETVYDLYEPHTDTWITEGYVSRGCGEQFLLGFENCCLGSVNLARHLGHDSDGRPVIEWGKLEETVHLAVRFLDDVVEANGYVPSIPQLKEAAHRSRRIGLGIMGLGDLLYHMGVRYGSELGQELSAQVMEFIRYHAMRASIHLAQERGPFPAIEGSIYDPQALRWQPPKPLTPFSHDFGRPPIAWDEIVSAIREHGIRNAAQTTVAPTGTIATVSGCEAYGCEPVFALAYTRHVNDEGKDVELHYTSPLFTQALEKAVTNPAERERIIREVRKTGSCQKVEGVPESLKEVFVVAGDITAEEHVRMQAALQAFVDASISKTINFPATAKPDDVARAFQLAWKLGCKGLTVYVTGSREKVVLETEATKKAKQQPRGMPISTKVRPRPHRLKGSTYRMATPLGTAYITINTNGDDEPFEVFLNVGKAGSDTAAVSEAIGRLISLVLRIPSPLSATKRLHQVVRQLKGIGGGRPLGFGHGRVQSLPDGIAQVLAEHLGLTEPAPPTGADVEQLSLFPGGDLCPECGQAALVDTEGCRRCYACGYSEC